MIDDNGRKISDEERDKQSRENELFLEINEKLNSIGLQLIGYIKDDNLYCCTKPLDESRKYEVPNIYIDGFKEDQKHAKLRFIPKPVFDNWISNEEEARKTMCNLQKQFMVYEELCEMDFSGLYKCYEKSDPTLQSGGFHFTSDNYTSAQIKPVIDYLHKRYNVDFIQGYGFYNDNRIVAVTPNKCAGFFDLHIFEEGKAPVTKSDVIREDYDFYVDGIIKDDGDEIGIKARIIRPTGYSKCHDKYVGYAALSNDGSCDFHPFIFVESQSEKDYGNPAIGEEKIDGKRFIVTEEEIASEEAALAYSKDYGLQKEMEEDERDL